jgi:hypothetical protein
MPVDYSAWPMSVLLGYQPTAWLSAVCLLPDFESNVEM